MNNSEESSPERMLADRDGCPYLGLRNDPQTRFGYPSLGNYCHHMTPPALVTPGYQQNWCFSKEFPSCVVYQGASKEKLPDGLIQKPESVLSDRNMLLAIGLIVVVIVLLILLVILIGRNRNISQQSQSQTGTALAANLAITPQATNTLPPSSTPTVEPTLTPTGTNTPTVTPTDTPALPTQGPGLETPFGPKNEYLIHKVVSNESLNIIALRYQTSAAVITATNELLAGASLQVDQILVIIPNQTEVSDLPVFRPLYLEQDASVDALAQEYGASASDLRRYNALGDSDPIPAGRWIIIPLQPQPGP